MMEEGPLAGFPVLDVELSCTTVASTRLTHQQLPLKWRLKAPSVSQCPRPALS